MSTAKLYTDGGARGNPGPSGMAALLFGANDSLIDFTAVYDKHLTNNQAEYMALIEGLKLAIKSQIKQLTCMLDSELIVRQLNGIYKVKNENILELNQRVVKLQGSFDKIEFIHIPRSQNKFADKLVNLIVDAGLNK